MDPGTQAVRRGYESGKWRERSPTGRSRRRCWYPPNWRTPSVIIGTVSAGQVCGQAAREAGQQQTLAAAHHRYHCCDRGAGPALRVLRWRGQSVSRRPRDEDRCRPWLSVAAPLQGPTGSRAWSWNGTRSSPPCRRARSSSQRCSTDGTAESARELARYPSWVMVIPRRPRARARLGDRDAGTYVATVDGGRR